MKLSKRLHRVKKRLQEQWSLESRDEFYVQKKLAFPVDVDGLQAAVRHRIAKNGHRCYRKNRARCERLVQKLLRRYSIHRTTSERFWYLWSVCELIGPAPSLKKRIVVLDAQKSSEKRRKKRHNRKHGNR